MFQNLDGGKHAFDVPRVRNYKTKLYDDRRRSQLRSPYIRITDCALSNPAYTVTSLVDTLAARWAKGEPFSEGARGTRWMIWDNARRQLRLGARRLGPALFPESLTCTTETTTNCWRSFYQVDKCREVYWPLAGATRSKRDVMTGIERKAKHQPSLILSPLSTILATPIPSLVSVLCGGANLRRHQPSQLVPSSCLTIFCPSTLRAMTPNRPLESLMYLSLYSTRSIGLWLRARADRGCALSTRSTHNSISMVRVTASSWLLVNDHGRLSLRRKGTGNIGRFWSPYLMAQSLDIELQ